MGIWSEWLDVLSFGIIFFTANIGLPEGIAIIGFTLLLRTFCMPLSLKATAQSYKNRLAMERLKPELETIKERYPDNPTELAKRTMALYKENGISFFNKTTFANIGAQGVLGLGMFQALKAMVFQSGFMWITNLAKPDVALAALVGAITFFSMLMMPGTTEHSNLLLFLIPAFFSAFILISFPSALGLYWLTSNVVTLVQQLIVRYWYLAKDGQQRTAS